jgi:DNA-directed RNA polymerase subunit RPC12/RpoP
MSESAREFLVRGIAAAKSNVPRDRDEARHCLEHVLRSEEAEPDQKANAWLWLSRIEENEEKKRLCLESVLALDPGNGTARRGLAILDGRLKPEEIIDPNQPLAPLSPSPKPPPEEVHRNICEWCGGVLSFDPAKQILTCSHCGSRVSRPESTAPDASIRERDFVAALSTAKSRRWQLAVEHTLRCDGCGATLALPPLRLSGACPFCKSKQLITTGTPELIQPEAVLPFQFDGRAALEKMRAWLATRPLRPPELPESAEFREPEGVYLPFWTFDLGGTMEWRAQVAERRGRHTQWVMRTGLYLVYHDDLLVPAGRKFPGETSDALLDFDTDALVPYDTGLLADAAVEIYQVPLEEASLQARRRALEIGRDHERRNALSGERYRDFFMNSAGLVVESFKLVLLPLWIGGFRYGQRNFPVAVNGQTGVAAGRVPRHGVRKMLAFLFGLHEDGYDREKRE